MNRWTPIILTSVLLYPQPASAFCGAYVGATGEEIQNHASRIVLSREDHITSLTMFNDFEGDASEFGMIIPIASTIDADNVQLVDPALLDRLDRYSAPRLVQYTCEDFFNDAGITIDPMVISPTTGSSASSARSVSVSASVSDDTGLGSSLDASRRGSSGCGGGSSRDYLTETDTSDDRVDTAHGVVIEDEFTLGEYEMWVVRATESEGLAEWLIENDFVLPDGAAELLDEYVSSDARFLALRINTELIPAAQEWLSPLQLTYSSDAWSLPIRLGTVSSSGVQDLIVYTLTPPEDGRVQISNYPETPQPGDECMLGVDLDQPNHDFSDQYEERWTRAAGVSQSSAGLAWSTEYSWGIDLSAAEPGVKCDPCPEPDPRDTSSDPITEDELIALGLQSAASGWHVTRLRLRYTPDAVPQDLMLYATNIQDQEQVRYIIRRWELEGLLPTCDAAPEEPGSCYSAEYWIRAAEGELAPVIAAADPGAMACKGEGRALLLISLTLAAVKLRRRREVV